MYTEAQRRCIEIVAQADSSDPFAARRMAKDIRKDKRVFLSKDETFDHRPRMNDPEENVKYFTDSALQRFNLRKADIQADYDETIKRLGIKKVA